MFLASNAKLNKALEITTDIKAERGTCREERGALHPMCEELASTKSAVNTFDGVAVSAASVGGLALVGMIVYLALPNPQPVARPTTGLRVNVLPTASQDSGGFLVTGSF
jgi:hypothetical protein